MIFNKNDKGAQELKSLLGFIYKSNSFANMISYIGFAQRDIRRIIGDEVFDCAQKHYDSNNYNLDPSVVGENVEQFRILDELVKNIQLPVALHAYLRYAVQNDLQHSDTGRSITVTEQQKPAFEWMIDKSDKSLLDLAHEATDLLLDFLNKYLDYKTGDEYLIPWGTSKAFEQSRSLLVNLSEFNQEFFINGSRRVFLAICPSLRCVQQTDIQAILSPSRYDTLIEQIKDGDLNEENEALLKLIRPALVFLALSKAVVSLSQEILPNGIFQNYVSGTVNSTRAVSQPERIQISKLLKSQGLEYGRKLQEKILRLDLQACNGEYTQEDPTERMDCNNLYFRP